MQPLAQSRKRARRLRIKKLSGNTGRLPEVERYLWQARCVVAAMRGRVGQCRQGLHLKAHRQHNGSHAAGAAVKRVTAMAVFGGIRRLLLGRRFFAAAGICCYSRLAFKKGKSCAGRLHGQSQYPHSQYCAEPSHVYKYSQAALKTGAGRL